MNLLSSLRYLVALSEHRHFARAAEACHITQPALSNALRALEREFETPIVKRARTYAGLTEEGERILLTARRMLHEHELLQQELRGGVASPTGALRLGAVPTAIPVAARFAAALQAQHPGIRVSLRSLSSQEIETGLLDLALDAGFGFTERVAGNQTGLTSIDQYEEWYFLLRRRQGSVRLEFGPPCTWKEAARLPLCLLTPEMYNRQIVQQAFADAGAELVPAMETNSVLALVVSVAAGELCSVVPGALVATVPAGLGLEAAPLVRPAVTTPVGLLVAARSEPSRTLQAAIEFARSQPWIADVQGHAGKLTSFRG